MIIGSLGLSGCAGETAAVPPVPTLPTATLLSTPKHTSTSSPTMVLANEFQKWTLQDVLDAFRTAKLEVGEVRKNDPSDLNGAPSAAVEFANFSVPSKGVYAGGLIFAFSSEADFQSVYSYYKNAGWYDSGLYYPWVYRKDNILLQINGILSDVEAEKYGDALQQLH
jgi:hypothetical protein